MRIPAHRQLAALVLTLWLTPTAGAFTLSLHVAIDHQGHRAHAHGHSADDHHLPSIGSELVDLLGFGQARQADDAAGHHHEGESASEHSHSTIVEETLSVLRSEAPWSEERSSACQAAMRSLSAAAPTTRGVLRPVERNSRHGPPTPLFTANCTLLL